MFKSLEFPVATTDLACLFSNYFNFGTFNVAQPCGERDSWPKRGLHGEHRASSQCQVHNLELKAAPPFPEQKEKQPGMVNLSACHSANVLQLSLQGSPPGVRG